MPLQTGDLARAIEHSGSKATLLMAVCRAASLNETFQQLRAAAAPLPAWDRELLLSVVAGCLATLGMAEALLELVPSLPTFTNERSRRVTPMTIAVGLAGADRPSWTERFARAIAEPVER